MSYINFIEHPEFGRVWYKAELRNWWVTGLSAEENRARGPLVEVYAHGIMLCAAGDDVQEAVDALVRALDAYGHYGIKLPRWGWKRALHYAIFVQLRWRLSHPIKFIKIWWSLRSTEGRVRLPRR